MEDQSHVLSDNLCDEFLKENILKPVSQSQSDQRILSDNFCDEIFNELEKTDTFPNSLFSSWSSSMDISTNERAEFVKTDQSQPSKLKNQTLLSNNIHTPSIDRSFQNLQSSCHLSGDTSR